MSRIWTPGEPVTVETTPSGWPGRFTWSGQTHRVRRILQRWQIDTDWWSAPGRVCRDYVALLTESGLLCVIFFDLLEGNWQMAKVYD